MVIVVIVLVVALLLGVAYASDRRDRKSGHKAGPGLYRNMREANRDARAIDRTPTATGNGTSWTAASRRDSKK